MAKNKEEYMYDTTMKIGNSKIQHGSQNNRIYLMDLDKEDMPGILNTIDCMANTYGYTKIFAKVPNCFSKLFLEEGYAEEATVPGFFNGKEDCIFMGKYRDKERSLPVDQGLNKKVIDNALLKQPKNSVKFNGLDHNLPRTFSFKKAERSDAHKMAYLYAKVFDSYPVPIFDPEYIKKTIGEDVVYFTIWKGQELVALSAGEMYIGDASVEMTDFAVLPEYRGYNFSYFLLTQMEKEMRKREIKTAYTIARSTSYAINSTFAKCGYGFAGILVKNTQIAGKIEDMNVWFKSLA